MKITIPSTPNSGKILIVTLVLALLVSLTVGALLVIAKQQNYLAVRSATWASEIPIAEAGIEEAMTHINTRPKNMATNGWTKSGNKYIKTRTLPDGYYSTTILTAPSTPPSIVSIGYGRIPLQSTFSSRSVMALTKLTPPGWGVVAKRTISMNGNPYIDSYDSSNPDYSNNGFYDPLERRDRVGVGVLSTNRPAINTGGGMIYGSAATGPGGTVSGNVGDGAWLTSNSGQQPGHVADDFNMAIPDVVLPVSTWSGVVLNNYTVSGITYQYVLPAGDYVFDEVQVSSGMGILVQGKVRIWVKGTWKMSGTPAVTLATGASLEMYIGGSMDLSGRCVINPTGIPANCSIYGLPTCTSMKYAGTAQVYCKLYAPNADLRVTGDFDFNGSVVGRDITFSGNASIHYDEALNAGAPDYKVASWEEQ